jgi:two-component sensor histidine kinase
MSTHWTNVHQPSPHQLALFDLYARHTADFIERTRMDERQAQREEQVRLLLREVNHRSKNMLAVVQSIARSINTAGGAFVVDFEKRIHSLARCQDLLIRNEWKGVDLHDLVQSQLAHLNDLIGTRIVTEGAAVMLAAPAAQTLGMAVHELATNAAKYGALSNETGCVQIAWSLSDDRDSDKVFRFGWLERDGPRVVPPHRRGFGTTVLERMTQLSLNASVRLDYEPNGLKWRVQCPASRVTGPRRELFG